MPAYEDICPPGRRSWESGKSCEQIVVRCIAAPFVGTLHSIVYTEAIVWGALLNLDICVELYRFEVGQSIDSIEPQLSGLH